MIEALGWIGSLLFALCAVPQAWYSYRHKSADGLSWPFLLMWLFGEILTIIYVWPTGQWPLITNYIFNLFCLSIIIRYKLR